MLKKIIKNIFKDIKKQNLSSAFNYKFITDEEIKEAIKKEMTIEEVK